MVKTEVEKHNAHVFRLLREIAQLKDENTRLKDELRNLHKTVNELLKDSINANG